MMPLASNALKIVNLRANGYRPDEMIIVSLVGRVDELNHTVFADPRQSYDWRWCRDLDVCVFASSAVKWLETIKAMADVRPRYLSLWDIDRKEGAEFWLQPDALTIEKPAHEWRWKLTPNVWIPMQNRMFEGGLCN